MPIYAEKCGIMPNNEDKCRKVRKSLSPGFYVCIAFNNKHEALTNEKLVIDYRSDRRGWFVYLAQL